MSLLWRRRSELHQDQINAIEKLSVDGRFLVMGPPGSGKTSILLHRGQYLRLPPHQLTNIRLITFSRTLREFIAIDGNDRFPANLIQTVKEFVEDVFTDYGASPPEADDALPLPEKNRILAGAALELVKAATVKRVVFDALLIDEIQDLSQEEIQLFGSLSKRLMFVGDSSQKLYDVDGGIATAEAIGCKKVDLKHHFRISPQICKVADNILRAGDYELAKYCHYTGPTPTDPVINGPLTPDAQIETLIPSLDIQLDTYNDPRDRIGIVVGRKRNCLPLLENLQTERRFATNCKIFHSGVADRSFPDSCKICIVTPQSCKGLEFRALHWLLVDETPYLTREKAYTIVTRARTSLSLYYNNMLPRILQGAFAPTAGGLFDDDE